MSTRNQVLSLTFSVIFITSSKKIPTEYPKSGYYSSLPWGARCGAVGWAGRSRVSFPMVSLRFFFHIILPVESASNRNEYQVYFLVGLKWSVRRADNLTTFMCRMSRNSGSLKFLEPSGPVQACTVLVLPFLTVFLSYPLGFLIQ